MKTVLLAVTVFVTFTLSARADRLVQPNDVVAIAGDSITAQHLYSAFMEDYLLMCQPTQGQKVVQFGWSGEQAPAFLARLDTDVFPFKPTVVTTCYGMNDGHYVALNDDTKNAYRTAQIAIVEAFKKKGVRVIVLGSSKCVDFTFFPSGLVTPEGYNATLGAFASIDQEIAAKEGVVYADVFGTTLEVMKKAKAQFGTNYVFAGPDGIHPFPNGHLVMAYTFLKALGYDGKIGTITVDYGTSQASGSPGQEIVSCRAGVVDVKSTRYPFCFSGTPDSRDPNTTAAIATVFPFNDDLNRYLLVVKGIHTAKAKVTWGRVSKEYTAANLARGVNLAADFLVNPFVEQFNKVNLAVQLQETQETVLFQTFMHSKTEWLKTYAPQSGAALDQLIATGMAQHDLLYQQAADLVIPIEHTIKIEPEN